MKIYLIKKLKDVYGDFEPSEDDKIVGIVDKKYYAEQYCSAHHELYYQKYNTDDFVKNNRIYTKKEYKEMLQKEIDKQAAWRKEHQPPEEIDKLKTFIISDYSYQDEDYKKTEQFEQLLKNISIQLGEN